MVKTQRTRQYTKTMTVIRVANFSSFPFRGWRRTTIGKRLPSPMHLNADGQVVQVVPARNVGDAAQAVDVFCTLQPGQELVIDVDQGQPFAFSIPQLPHDLATHFGGLLKISGWQMRVLEVGVEGAAVRAKAQTTVATSDPNAWALVQGELLFWPDTDSVVQAEFAVTACGGSPTMPVDSDMRLTWGDAFVMVHGASADGVLLQQGKRLGRGQLCWFAVTFAWPRHFNQEGEAGTVLAQMHNGICAVGLDATLPEGATLFPSSFSARQWVAKHWPEVWRRLHTWERSDLGPESNSGNTGRQEVQLHHCGGEALQRCGVGGAEVRLASAMHVHGKWPCHHREVDGAHVDQRNHPELRMYAGQPHYSRSVSPDQLGYSRPLLPGDANGFAGPSPQHWYISDLAAAALLTGSRMAQAALCDHAHLFLLSTTLNPSLSIYSPDGAARTWGCWAMLAMGLWKSLDDRELAQRVVDRFAAQIAQLYAPRILANGSTQGLPIWAPLLNDPRVEPNGMGAAWWQEAFAAGAIYRFARHFGGMGDVMQAAAMCAEFVMDRAWHTVDVGTPSEHWRAQAQGPIDGSPNEQNPASYWNDFGHPMGIWAVLQDNPSHPRARSIWAELMRGTGETSMRWMLPWQDPDGHQHGTLKLRKLPQECRYRHAS